MADVSIEVSDVRDLIDLMLDALTNHERPTFKVNGKVVGGPGSYPMMGRALPDDPLLDQHKARLQSVGKKGKHQKNYREAVTYLGYLLAQPTPAATRQRLMAVSRIMNRIGSAELEKRPYQNRGFSDRTITALLDCGISDPERLLSMTKEQISRIPGVGKVSLSEIMAYKQKFS